MAVVSLRRKALLLVLAAPMAAWGLGAKSVSDGCGVYRVADLPGSHEYASEFLETIVDDPSPRAGDADRIWALTADLSSWVPRREHAIYLIQSGDGGETWKTLARMGPKYFDAEIGEGLRNGLAVAPGGRDFVITTQRGAFQVVPFQPVLGTKPTNAAVRTIAGPRVPHIRPKVVIAKHEGDPVRANVVAITADGKRMIVGYGYFDLQPQLFSYRRGRRGAWVEDGRLPPLPTDMDILSMQFDRPGKAHPRWLYVGTGDQAYRLDLRTRKWTRVDGVGPDSAIHGMSMVGGPHFAACWAVYNPVDAGTVTRVTEASFLLHPGKDVAGPNVRAYGIEVDAARPDREVLTAITGVYVSRDSGKTWRRLNDLPEGEYRTAHFNADGTAIVSGLVGTFVVRPFAKNCGPRLRIRGE